MLVDEVVARELAAADLAGVVLDVEVEQPDLALLALGLGLSRLWLRLGRRNGGGRLTTIGCRGRVGVGSAVGGGRE